MSSAETWSAAALAPNVSVMTFASGLRTPRGLLLSPAGDYLVLERGASPEPCVTVLWDQDGDGRSAADERLPCIAGAPRLNHGLAMYGGYLFASSDTVVYRWPWNERSMLNVSDRREVVTGIAYGADGSDLGAESGHTTQTLAFDLSGRLFVSVGSRGNVDADSHRSRVRVFDGVALPTATSVDFNSGAVWADGLRNEVGLALDAAGTLWGVENGADNLNRADIGGDVHNDNPGEEVNRLDQPGRFYGYPRCWSEHTLAAPHGLGARTQWAWPSFMPSTTDAWCRDPANNVSPAMVMAAHTAPLGIAFFGARDAHQPPQSGTPPCTNASTTSFPGGFPCAWVGDAFVAQHGSWNRDIPVGYAIVRLPFTAGGNPTGEEIPVLRHGGAGAKWPSGLRPVDVRFDRLGRLAFTCDKTGLLVRLTYTSSETASTTGSASQGQGAAGVAGIVVGAIVGAALLSMCVAIAARAWRKKKRAGESGSFPPTSSNSLDATPQA
jgi:glucose/arabinose dehydrogenase